MILKIQNLIMFFRKNIKFVFVYIIFLVGAIFCVSMPLNSVIKNIYSISLLDKLNYSFVEITNTPLSKNSFVNLTEYVNSAELNSDVLMMIQNIDYNDALFHFDLNQNEMKYQNNNETICFVSSSIQNDDAVLIKFLPNNYVYEYIPIQIATFPGLDNYYDHEMITIIPFNLEIYSKIQSKEYISFASEGDVISGSRFSLSKKTVIENNLYELSLLLFIYIGIFFILCFILFSFNRKYLYKIIKTDYLDGKSINGFLKTISLVLLPGVSLIFIVPFFMALYLIGYYGVYIIGYLILPIVVLIITFSFFFLLIYRGVKYV